MKYIIIGVLVGLGWHLARLVYEVISELLFCRLHKTKWYPVIAGKKPKDVKNRMEVKTVKNKIGF